MTSTGRTVSGERVSAAGPGRAVRRLCVAAFVLAPLASCGPGPGHPCVWYDKPYYWRGVSAADVRECVARGADVTEGYFARSGRKPLHFAAALSGDPAVIEALLAAGAPIAAREIDRGQTALHGAARANGNPAVVKALIRGGAEVNARDSWAGSTPLHLATFNENNPAGIIAALIRGGANTNARDEDGETPLQMAERNGNTQAAAAIRETVAALQEERRRQRAQADEQRRREQAAAEERRRRERQAAEQRRREQAAAEERRQRERQAAEQRRQREAEERRRREQGAAETPAPPAGPPPPEAVSEAQELLIDLGYDPGPVDGNWSGPTARAYRGFLLDSSLPVTALMTPDGLRALRRAAADADR